MRTSEYRKLELLVVNLKSNLETVKADLECANMDKQKYEAEKQFLEGSLRKAMGERQQADWFARGYAQDSPVVVTKLTSAWIQSRVDEMTPWRRTNSSKEVMAECARCSRKLMELTKKQVHRGGNHVPQDRSLPFWSTLNVAIGDFRQKRTQPHRLHPMFRMRPVSAELRQPPKEMFLFKEQSNQIKLDLEADIVALEKKMQDDVEALKSEWSKPSPTSIVRGRRKHRNDGKKHRDRSRKEGSSNGSSSIGGVGSLDSFFASAAQGLSL
jgi:hypothetical protein